MSISELNSMGYVSPFGSQAMFKHISASNASTNGVQNDSFIRKHKEKDNTLRVIGNVLLTGAAIFGIYKGKGQIKQAWGFIKNNAGKAYNYVKQNGFVSSAIQGVKNLGQKAQNGFSSFKTKVTSMNIGQTLKSLPSTAWNGIKTLASKIHK